MWRTGGQGELYLYANRESQDPAICENPTNICDPEWGWSLSRGAFSFQTGAWNEIEQQLTLNTDGLRNGIISIKVNGVERIRYDNIVFRIAQYPNMTIDGLDVETFFGGNTPDWASPTRQMSQFTNFVLISEEEKEEEEDDDDDDSSSAGSGALYPVGALCVFILLISKF